MNTAKRLTEIRGGCCGYETPFGFLVIGDDGEGITAIHFEGQSRDLRRPSALTELAAEQLGRVFRRNPQGIFAPAPSLRDGVSAKRLAGPAPHSLWRDAELPADRRSGRKARRLPRRRNGEPLQPHPVCDSLSSGGWRKWFPDRVCGRSGNETEASCDGTGCLSAGR